MAPRSLAIAAAMGLFGSEGCQSSGPSQSGGCHCGVVEGQASILLPCGTTESPSVMTTGRCIAGFVSAQTVVLTSSAAGTCHIELTFAGGGTSAADIDFVSEWLPCGDDPHGCGQGIVATSHSVSVGPQCVESGVDSGPVDDL